MSGEGDDVTSGASVLDVSVVIPTLGRPAQAAALSHKLETLTPRMREALFVFQDIDDLEAFQALEPAASSTALLADRKSAGYARNWGLHRASCALVAFLDDDCVPAAGDWLAALVAPLSHPKIALTTGAVLGWGSATGRLPGTSKAFQLWPPFLEPVGHPDSAIASFCDTVAGGNFAARTADLRAVGGFSDVFQSPSLYEETELSIRVMRVSGGRIRYVPHAAVRHEQELSGGMRSDSDGFSTEFVDSQRWLLLREVYGDSFATRIRFGAYRLARKSARTVRGFL